MACGGRRPLVEHGAKIVVIDVYENATMKQADMGLVLKPGTDGALACAVMHVLFRDGMADRAYLEKYTDDPHGLEAHLQGKTPEWAAGITDTLPLGLLNEAYGLGKPIVAIPYTNNLIARHPLFNDNIASLQTGFVGRRIFAHAAD